MQESSCGAEDKFEIERVKNVKLHVDNLLHVVQTGTQIDLIRNFWNLERIIPKKIYDNFIF